MKRVITFPNLEIELIRAHISKGDLAKEINISIASLYSKLRGDTQFTLSEVRDIKYLLETKLNKEYSYEYLFKTDV
jgi:hypothetical protein